MREKEITAGIQEAIISILKADSEMTGYVPHNRYYKSDDYYRNKNKYPGITVELKGRMKGDYSTGKKEIALAWQIRMYTPKMRTHEASRRLEEMVGRFNEIFEGPLNYTVNGFATDSQVTGVDYQKDKAGDGVESVSKCGELIFETLTWVDR